MANVDNPHGLSPLMRTLSGGPVVIETFSKLVGYGTAIFRNDVVIRVASGDIQACTASDVPSGVSLNYSAASTAADHMVVISPQALYEAQDNNDTDGIAFADLGFNADLEFNAGSATTQISGHEIDESTAGTGATLYVHLLKLLAVPDNAYGSYARIEIVFNKHRMATATAGV